jgi:type IV secretory pathway VirB4 component
LQDSVHQNTNENSSTSTQMYLRIAEIHDDVVVLKNGGLRAVLEVEPINANLKSEDEQNALTYAYQNFLNSLEFPVQIVVRSKKLDISTYLGKLRQAGKTQTNELLKNQITEYSEYIRRLVEFTDIMEKHFYLIIPFDPPRVKTSTNIEKFWNFIHPADSATGFRRRKEEFAKIIKDLNQRVEQIMSGLENCGLHAKRLITSQLIQLFYEIYNPLTARNEKVDDTGKLDLVG